MRWVPPHLLANFNTPVHAIRLPLSNIVDATSAIVREIIATILLIALTVVLPIALLVRSIVLTILLIALTVVLPIGTVLRSRSVTRPRTLTRPVTHTGALSRSLTGLWRAVLQKVRGSVARTTTRSR